MKKTLITLLMAVMTFGLSQSANAQLEPVPGNKNDLCQKWQIDVDAFLNDLPEEMKAMMEMLPPDQKEQTMSTMKEQMAKVTVQFFKDGTMVATGDEGEKQGTWSFSDDKKTITTIAGDDQKTTTLEILVMSGNKLKMREQGKPKDPAITFKPAE